jgi:hypothetical protein
MTIYHTYVNASVFLRTDPFTAKEESSAGLGTAGGLVVSLFQR